MKTIKIKNCTQCPHVETGQCQGTISFSCKHPKTKKHWIKEGFIRWDGTVGRLITQECECPSEFPKTIPKWCPL